eukprot:TRINITY_DN196_c0_g1_i1.p1 TRINITY_DN196_c0_g1~~TRINITY_DN196_c0_g1_i1.p1  ORF type:complete len:367 (+),score=50.00 TRINITY_DN196_c0_g1_i1:309-1409(+)
MDSRGGNARQNSAETFSDTRAVVVGCKTGLSSLFFSSVCSTFAKPLNEGQKRHSFAGLSCTSAPDVHLPTTATKVVRASADWHAQPTRRKSCKVKRNAGSCSASFHDAATIFQTGSHVIADPFSRQSAIRASRRQVSPIVDDIGSSESMALATELPFVDSAARQRVSGINERRGIMDVQPERRSRERSCFIKSEEHSEKISDIVMDVVSESTEHASELRSIARNRRPQGPRRSSAAFAEQLLMLEASFLLGRSIDTYDQHRDWRLDVDSMSYEDLLELGDRIGYVSTGLTEEKIIKCLRKIKASLLQTETSLLSENERKCSVCQDEYEANDELGKLYCGHTYHAECIKQWLLQKNLCPICKASASS